MTKKSMQINMTEVEYRCRNTFERYNTNPQEAVKPVNGTVITANTIMKQSKAPPFDKNIKISQ